MHTYDVIVDKLSADIFGQVHLVHAKSGKDLATIDDVSILIFSRNHNMIKFLMNIIFVVKSIIIHC